VRAWLRVSWEDSFPGSEVGSGKGKRGWFRVKVVSGWIVSVWLVFGWVVLQDLEKDIVGLQTTYLQKVVEELPDGSRDVEEQISEL
jgi:hypothetical protein